MSARNELAHVIHRRHCLERVHGPGCRFWQEDHESAEACLAAGYRKPPVIENDKLVIENGMLLLEVGSCTCTPYGSSHEHHCGYEYLDDLTKQLERAGYRKPRTISTPEELDALPIRSIIALISHSRNVPVVIVFQRGSIEHGGDGWCTPEAIGQIPSEAVFEFIALNGFPATFTVLHEPEAAA